MATIQERLDRLKQIGEDNEAISIQQRLDRLKRLGEANKSVAKVQSGPSVTLPTAQQGTVTLPRASESGGGGQSVPSASPMPTVRAPAFVPASAASRVPALGARNTEVVQTDINGVNRALQGLKEKRDTLNGQARSLDNRVSAWGRLGYSDPNGQDAQQAEQLRLQAGELDESIAQLERNKAGLQTEWNQADQRQFEALRQTADFQAAVAKAMSAPIGQSVDSQKPSYRDVRNAMTYIQIEDSEDERFSAASSGSTGTILDRMDKEQRERMAATVLEKTDMALDRMSRSQRERLAYYVGLGDYDGAADYLNRIAPELNQQAAAQFEQGMAEWSQAHPVQGAAVNMVSWPLNIPAYVANAKQAAKNLVTGKNEQDPHLTAYAGAKIGTGTSKGVSEAARNAATQTFGSETAGDVAAFLASTGLSMGQNATQIAILGPYSLAGMSISAAGSATADALDRGATPQQAFIIGTAGGTIEAVTEKIPLENLFRLAKEGGGVGLKAAVKELLKQMGTEAGEEMISEIANNIVDTAVMGDNSEFQMYVKELQEAGLSKDEAEQQAYLQFYLINVSLAGLGGAISGGVMSGGAMMFHQAGQYAQQLNADTKDAQRVNAAIDRAYQAMAEKGMFSQEAGQAVQDARKQLDSLATGVFFPTAEQGTVTLPGGEDAVVEGQRFAEPSLQTEGGARHASENDALRGQLTPQPSVQTPQAAGQSVETNGREIVSNLDTTAGQEQTDVKTKTRLEQIQEVKHGLREGLRQGMLTEEEFDAAMDAVMEQESLAGLSMLDGPDPAAMRANISEGGAENGTGEFERTATPGEQQLPGGGAQRAADQGAGGQAGVLAEGGSQRAADPGRAAVERQTAGRALRLETVSSRELGIDKGTDTKSVRLMPEEAWDGELRSIARKVRRETGFSVRFTLGSIEVMGSDGAVHRVRGAYGQDGIIVQADHLRVSAAQIADHEIFHSYAQENPGLVQAVEDAIVERYGQEEMDRIVDEYIKDLRGIVDVPESGTDLDFEQAFADIKEEVFADAFAGINAFGAHAEQYQDTVLETLESRGVAETGGRENSQAVDQRTGPPARYSIDYDQENRPFVTVEEDILDGVPRENWVKTVKDNLRKKFPNGVTVGSNEIKINNQSRREMTFSQYMQRALKTEPQLYADKLRATNNADEILRASQNWVNEALLHPRKDAIIDFARGEVQLRVGGNDYTAQVVVGNRGNGNLLMYDIINLTPTVIQDRTVKTGADNTTKPHEGTGSRRSAPVFQDSIPQQGQNVKNQTSGFFFPTAEQGTVTLPGGVSDSDTTGRERFSVDEDDVSNSDTPMDGIPLNRGEVLDGSMLPTLAEVMERRAQENAGNVSDSGTGENGQGEASQESTEQDQKQGSTTSKKKTTKPIAESKPVIAKKELRQTMLSLFSIPEGMRTELGMEVDRLADRALKNGGLTQADRDAFFDRMYESGAMELEVEEYQRAGRDAVKGKKIYVPEEIKHEFGGSTEWNDFRKRAFAAGILLTNQKGDNGIDSLNSELSQILPGLFDPKETDNRTILERIVQIAEEGQAEKVSLREYTAMLAGQEYVSENEVLDNLERQMDWALRTFAEKAKLELKLRDRTGVKLAQQRDAFVQRDVERRIRETQRKAEERERRRETAERKREAKALREMQDKTFKQLQWLKRNQDRAPSELKEAFGEVLGDLDIYAVGAAKATRWNKKHGATWQDLAQMYKDARENDPNFLPSKELERIVARIDGAKVEDLDVDALQNLYKAAVGLRTEYENRKQLVHDKFRRQVDEVFFDCQKELETAPGSGRFRDKGLDKLMNLEQLSPMNVMERMVGWNPDSTFYSMAKQLEQGERDIRAYAVEANRQLKDFLTEHEDWVKKSDGQGKDAMWYEIEVPALLEYGQMHKPIFGDTVKVYMTPAQKVHLYLESKGEDNKRHMEGGRTFPNKELYAAGKRQEAFAQGTTIKIAPETAIALAGNMTEEEMELARILERYYNEFAKDRINEVSNALYGYDKAMGKYYAPIYTDANYNLTELGVYDATAEGVGRMKSRVFSLTPSYNLSAMDAFERHVEQTARFVGMSIPHRNWDFLLNWREHTTEWTATSLKKVISDCWGDAGLKYIEDTVQTLQGGTRKLNKDMVSTGTDKLFSNYISAVFGANPSIVFKQMGSIPMAGAWLEFKNFPSPAQIARIDRGLIAKYTQELDWRTMGYSMPETKQLKDNPNWSQTNKVTSFLFGGDAITAMDGWAASVLWPWAENKVRRDNPNLTPGTQEQINSGTDPFYQKVAEEFNDAVARSQSTSDEMHQGALRKSKNPIARTFTMFKSDSSQLYNAVRQMAGEAAYYKRMGDDRNAKKARRKLGAALLAALGGYIWAEGVEFLINLWKQQGKRYRDEEGDLTAQSVVTEMGMGLVSDLTSVIPGGEELVDILGNIVTGDTWYGIDAPGLEQLTDVLELLQTKGQNGLDTLLAGVDVVKNGGNLPEYLRRHSGDIIGGIKETVAAAATYLPGLPVNNLEAYILGTVKWVSPELATAYEDALATANKNRLSGLSGDALTQRVETLFDVRNVNPGEDGARAISALYEAGWKNAVPADTPGSISINSESRELSAYQQQIYDRVWSGAIGDTIGELTDSKEFQNADDETRAQMLEKLYGYAGEKAKGVLFEDYAPDCEDADAFITAGGSAAQWAAWQGRLGTLARTAKGEGRSVKQTEKLATIQEKDWPDEVKVAAVGTILGTDLKTESGNPTQYAKLLEAVENGGSVNTWLAAKGLSPETGKKTVSDAQKWRAVLDAANGETDQKAALLAVMSDSARTKYEIADSFGIKPEAWVQLKEALPQFDANENGSYSGEEIENAIDALGGNGALLAPWDKDPLRLSREEKAVLWQLYTGSKSGSGNPYSTRVGKQVAKALEEAREKEE